MHVHSWEPVWLRCGRYECACGAQAWRDYMTGELRVLKSGVKYRERIITASDTSHIVDSLRYVSRFFDTCPENTLTKRLVARRRVRAL